MSDKKHPSKPLQSTLLNITSGEGPLPIPCIVRYEVLAEGILLRPFRQKGLFKMEPLEHVSLPYPGISLTMQAGKLELRASDSIGQPLAVVLEVPPSTPSPNAVLKQLLERTLKARNDYVAAHPEEAEPTLAAEAEARSKRAQPLSQFQAKYAGGANTLSFAKDAWGRNSSEHPLLIKVYPDGVQVCTQESTGFLKTECIPQVFLPFAHLRLAEVKTEEQISKDVTLGRLLVFGVLAFGMKKTRKTVQSFLAITGKDDSGIDQTFILSAEPKQSLEYARLINGPLQTYLSTHPAEIRSLDASQTLDIPSQIEKLAALVEKGLLRKDEFEAKKKDLLSRM